MREHPHILRRGATYWWRRRVPSRFVIPLNCFELKICLRTHEPRLAIRRARRLDVAADEFFEGLSQVPVLSAHDRDRILRRLHDILEAEARYPEKRNGATTYRDFFGPLVSNEDGTPLTEAQLDTLEIDGHGADELFDEDAYFAAMEIDQLRFAMTNGDAEPIADKLDEAAKVERLVLDPTDRALVPAALNIAIRAAETKLAVLEGRWSPAAMPALPPTSPPPVVIQSQRSAGNLSQTSMAELVAKYREENILSKNKADELTKAWSLWSDLVGSALKVSELKHGHANHVAAFRIALGKLPTLSRVPPFIGRRPSEQIKIADAIQGDKADPPPKSSLKRGQPVPRLDLKTVNKHLTTMSSVVNYFVKGDMLEKNPFSFILYSKKQLRKSKTGKARTNLGPDQIKALFYSPIWLDPAPFEERDELFWTPLVALYSGMRREEVLQLWDEDVFLTEKDGWFFCIREGQGRNLKSASDEAQPRNVPVHPVLERLGFLDFVENRRASGHPRLFPALFKEPTARPLKSRFTRRFGYYKEKLGLVRWEDLHALRHTFDTRLQNLEVASRLISYLMGHTGGTIDDGKPRSMTDFQYFGGYDKDVLVRATRKLSYPVMDELIERLARRPLANGIGQRS